MHKDVQEYKQAIADFIAKDEVEQRLARYAKQRAEREEINPKKSEWLMNGLTNCAMVMCVFSPLILHGFLSVKSEKNVKAYFQQANTMPPADRDQIYYDAAIHECLIHIHGNSIESSAPVFKPTKWYFTSPSFDERKAFYARQRQAYEAGEFKMKEYGVEPVSIKFTDLPAQVSKLKQKYGLSESQTKETSISINAQKAAKSPVVSFAIRQNQMQRERA